jgi:hypothetical protein
MLKIAITAISATGAVITFVIYFSYIADVFKLAVSGVYKVLIFSIPVWALLAIIIPAVIVFIRYYKNHRLPDWYLYTKMLYNDRLFTWKYIDGKPANINELCKQCEQNISGKTVCPNCNSSQIPSSREPDYYELIKDLKNVIRQNIEKGNYRQYLGQQKWQEIG